MKGLRGLLVLASAWQLGCAAPNGPLESVEQSQLSVTFTPIGVPFLLGGHGSLVPITDELSLTARHVAEIDFSVVVAYHPHCDLALVERNNQNELLPSLGRVYANQLVTTVGRGSFGEFLVGKGIYYQDVQFTQNRYFAHCPASLIDAPVQRGMSGGGVYNQESELVGIITAQARGVKLANGAPLTMERVSVFVSLLYAKPWLHQALSDYYGHSVELSF